MTHETLPPARQKHGRPETTEQYLKAVFEYGEVGLPAIRSRLAVRLGCSIPTVSTIVSRLVAQGYLEDGGDRNLHLTPVGWRIAVSVIRRHRLSECMMRSELDVPWVQVHAEAEKWQHALSDDIAHRIELRLGSPARSPYGVPIPEAEEADWGISRVRGGAVSLVEAAPRFSRASEWTLSWIGEAVQTYRSLLETFEAAGVTPGERILVESDRDGFMMRNVAAPTSDPVVLDSCLAAQVFVSSDPSGR